MPRLKPYQKGPVPTHFIANNGKRFEVKVMKINVKSFKLKLEAQEGSPSKVIRVNRKSTKLVFP